ncbi:V-type immunoglobulin domain-containing suppressor of T-cell activation isoform X2 [Sceloporus undulatus]|uniref:V-type immunoglobulin domain-containing suppressor of T-cell activation isoform X2 n=1 Tax=Sceloporus undulatus TaxID=8520 RepID=UPI001C4CD355|nr:V-type immunoglobulin domain-containing suppressor of T-cell activation isoform X2 [Sceloporus undulatus]
MEGAGKWWLLLLLQLTFGLSPQQVQSTTFRITTPYSLYICPEGQKVTLTCKLSGTLANRHDAFSKVWYFSNKADQSCSQRKHVRNVTMKELHHELQKHHGLPAGNNTAGKASQGQQENYHGVETSSDHHGTFHLTMANLTLQDSGHYCCYVVEFNKEHNKPHAQQQAHGVMELRIQKDITAAALATGACIVGILCLPLILLLIYKQRQAITNRRAHELVRMESNADGIDNPVFDDIPTVNSEPKPRPQLTYMARRLPSESVRHLLSEPNTPLSPPGPGDCFFPSLEPVPDSPNVTNI